MQIALSVEPFERVAHRGEIKTRTLKPEGCGTPHTPSMTCGSGILLQCPPVEKRKRPVLHTPAGSSSLRASGKALRAYFRRRRSLLRHNLRRPPPVRRGTPVREFTFSPSVESAKMCDHSCE